MQPYYAGGHGGGHPVFDALLVVLILLLVVAVGSWLYWQFRGRRAGGARFVPAVAGGPSDPLGIVRLRYARGEIGREEFRRLNADLGGAPPAVADVGEAPTVEQPAAAEPVSDDTDANA